METTSGGATPATAPAVISPVAAPAPTSSLTPPSDPVARAQSSKSPGDIRALLSDLRKASQPPQNPVNPREVAKPDADEPPAPAEAPASEETPAETTPEPEAETPAETTPAPTPEADADDDEADDGPVTASDAKKLRLRLPENDKVGRLAASFMKRNRDMGMEEAMTKAKAQLGIKAEPAEAKETAPDNSPASKLPQTTEAVDAQIAALRAQRKKANTELNFEVASDLSDQLEDLIQHKADLQRQGERQQAQAERDFTAKWKTAEAKASELYPDAAKPDSAFGKRMQEIDAALEETSDPLFHDPEKPRIVAQMVAREMNIAPRSKTAPAAPAKAAAPVTPQPKKGILPGGASRTTQPVANAQPAINAEVGKIKNPHDFRKFMKGNFGLKV